MPTFQSPVTPPTGPGMGEYLVPLALGGLSYYGQQQTNAANASQAREQMAFQERMRATQWQATVADMKKAGINPALAYSQGGAGTPGGAQATMQNAAGAGANSASSAATTLAMLRKTAADTELVNQQIQSQQLDNEKKDTELQYGYRRAHPSSDEEGGIPGMLGKYVMPWDLWMQRQKLLTDMRNTNSASELASMQQKVADIDEQLKQLQKPQAEAEADLYRKAGKFSYMIPGAKAATDILGDFIPKWHIQFGGKKK